MSCIWTGCNSQATSGWLLFSKLAQATSPVHPLNLLLATRNDEFFVVLDDRNKRPIGFAVSRDRPLTLAVSHTASIPLQAWP